MKDITYSQNVAVRMNAMPKRVRWLAEWFLENKHLAPFLTTDYMRQFGYYRKDITVFCRYMGYTGWLDFKKALVDEYKADMERYMDLKKDKAKLARILYARARSNESKRLLKHCPCGSDLVFKAGGKWYLALESGDPEPEITFCPACGRNLKKKGA